MPEVQLDFFKDVSHLALSPAERRAERMQERWDMYSYQPKVGLIISPDSIIGFSEEKGKKVYCYGLEMEIVEICYGEWVRAVVRTDCDWIDKDTYRLDWYDHHPVLYAPYKHDREKPNPFCAYENRDKRGPWVRE